MDSALFRMLDARVRACEERCERQKASITDLRRQRRDTALAEKLLANIEATLLKWKEHREQLRRDGALR